MLKTKLVQIMVICGLFPVMVFAETIQCPQTLVVTESTPAKNGWSSYKVTSGKTLNSATIYEGVLGDTQASLAPEESEAHNQLTQTWTLESTKRSYWMQCQYHNTGAIIMRKLPESITHCKNILLLDEQHNAASAGAITCE